MCNILIPITIGLTNTIDLKKIVNTVNIFNTSMNQLILNSARNIIINKN
mgnify:CR=1 FL=1